MITPVVAIQNTPQSQTGVVLAPCNCETAALGAGEQYLVFATATYWHQTLNRRTRLVLQHGTEILRDVTMQARVSGSELGSNFSAQFLVLGDGVSTLAFQMVSSSGAGADPARSTALSIVAVKLSELGEEGADWVIAGTNDAGDSAVALDSGDGVYKTILQSTLSLPASTRDWLVWANLEMAAWPSAPTSADGVDTRFLVNGAEVSAAHQEAGSQLEEGSVAFHSIVSLSGVVPIQIDCAMRGALVRTARRAHIVAIRSGLFEQVKSVVNTVGLNPLANTSFSSAVELLAAAYTPAQPEYVLAFLDTSVVSDESSVGAVAGAQVWNETTSAAVLTDAQAEVKHQGAYGSGSDKVSLQGVASLGLIGSAIDVRVRARRVNSGRAVGVGRLRDDSDGDTSRLTLIGLTAITELVGDQIELADFPSDLDAGDSLRLTYKHDTYSPADGWSARLELSGPGAITLYGEVDPEDPDGFVFDIASATTIGWAAGRYEWALRLIFGMDRVTPLRGLVTVDTSPGPGATGDTRSWAQQKLEQLEAFLLTKDDTSSFTIFGRTFSKENHVELMQARQQLLREIAAEEAAERARRGLPSRRTTRVRF